MRERINTIGAVLWALAAVAWTCGSAYMVWNTYDQRQRANAFVAHMEARDVTNQRQFSDQINRIRKWADSLHMPVTEKKL